MLIEATALPTFRNAAREYLRHHTDDFHFKLYEDELARCFAEPDEPIIYELTSRTPVRPVYEVTGTDHLVVSRYSTYLQKPMHVPAKYLNHVDIEDWAWSKVRLDSNQHLAGYVAAYVDVDNLRSVQANNVVEGFLYALYVEMSLIDQMFVRLQRQPRNACYDGMDGFLLGFIVHGTRLRATDLEAPDVR